MSDSAYEFRSVKNGGEGGIRTPDTITRMPHFECGAFNHSATSPSFETTAYFWRLNPEHNCSANKLLTACGSRAPLLLLSHGSSHHIVDTLRCLSLHSRHDVGIEIE